MNLTTKAITLKATDYKDNDKLLTLYSLDHGKITVHARGIKKSTAKLKFAGEPFCFAQFDLAQNKDRFTLTSCEQLESFFALREDIVAFYAGCAVVETLNVMEPEGQGNPQVFVATLKALSELCQGVNAHLVTLHFLTVYLDLCGYKLQTTYCSSCQERYDGPLYLDLQYGGFVCESCRTANSLAVSKSVKSLLQLLDGLAVEKLKNINVANNHVKDALQLLSTYIAHSFYKVKSLAELIKM